MKDILEEMSKVDARNLKKMFEQMYPDSGYAVEREAKLQRRAVGISEKDSEVIFCVQSI